MNYITYERVKTAEEALVYWADCAVATYAEAMMKKTSSQAAKRRFLSIAEQMIAHARLFGAHPEQIQWLEDRLGRSKEIVP